MSLTDDAKKLEDQMTIYRDAFNKVKADLTQARTDLAAQAKVTVDILDARIPTLRQDVLIKENQLSNLDKAIEEKNARLNAEESDLKAHYKKLEQGLINDYELRSKGVDAQRAELNKASLDLSHRAETLNSDMNQREFLVKEKQADFLNRESALSQAIKDLNEQKDIFYKEIHDTEDRIISLEKSAKEINQKASDKNREADDRLSSVVEREQRAEKVIALQNELNARQDSLNERDAKLDAKEDSINAKNTSSIAERNRLLQKEKELKDKERIISRREEELKTAEAKIDG